MNKLRFILLSILLIVLTTISIIYLNIRNDGLLKVYFLDIGQGDAVYIRTPNGSDMLIDAGPSVSILRRLSEVMPWYDRNIDIVLATHPDADHIGGIPPVIERYEIGMYIESGAKSKNSIDDKINELVLEKEIEDIVAKRGMKIDFGDGTIFDILYPDKDMSNVSDTNSASIVGQLRFGSTSVMFTGDAPKSVENYLIDLDGGKLNSQILKVGHHGSKTSTGENFVKVVSPDISVISAGKDNRYHHPNFEVLDILEKFNIKVFRTDELGTIRFVSDGFNFK